MGGTTGLRVRALCLALSLSLSAAAVVSARARAGVELIPGERWVTFGAGRHSPSRERDVLRELVNADGKFALATTGRTTPVQGSGTSGGAKSTFNVKVVGAPDSLQVGPAIQKCVSVIEMAWVSRVPVSMQVLFVDLGGPDVLAVGGGGYSVRMVDQLEEVMPVAAAEAIRGEDLNGKEKGESAFDVLIKINIKSPWYVGVDGRVPREKYDLVTVLLHEIYHSLIFTGALQVDIKKDASVPGGVRQFGLLKSGVRTRFDSFLSNKDNCAVLDYLNDKQLAAQLQKTNAELLADSLTNGELYFSASSFTSRAKLYSPRVFKEKSSVYHLDVGSDDPNAIMSPTVRRGSAIHIIGPLIIQIQVAFLDPRVRGANTRCNKPLRDPTPARAIAKDDFGKDTQHGGGISRTGSDFVAQQSGERRIANLPVWAFALIITFAIIAALLLIGLCIALCLSCLKKRRGTSYHPTTIFSGSGGYKSGSKSYSRTGSGGVVGYVPGMGGSATKSHKSKSATCPSTGRSRHTCRCANCHCFPMPPPPVAHSVHTCDPSSVPSVHTTKKSSSKKPSSHHTHRSCHRGCHCCCCCRYNPATMSVAKCPTKAASSKKSSTKVPSTKPPSTKAPSSKEPSSSEAPSSSKSYPKSSSKHSHRCKCPSAKCTSVKCPSCACVKCPSVRCPSVKCPSTRAPSTKAPSTKVPSTKVPSTKPPSKSSTKHSAKVPSTKAPSKPPSSAKVSPSSRKTVCKSVCGATSKSCGCSKCRRPRIEINVMNGGRC